MKQFLSGLFKPLASREGYEKTGKQFPIVDNDQQSSTSLNQFEELSGLLNGLWASDVLDYDFDIIRNRISFKLRSYNTYTNASRERTLSLERVAGFHFVDSYADGDEADYLEMMSIDILEEAVIIKQFSSWSSERFFEANLFFEIWNQEFFVDTRRIVLDDAVWEFMAGRWVRC